MRHIGVVVFPGFQILDMVAVSIFELANLEAGQPEYEVEIISEHGGMVRSSAGVEVATRPFGDPAYDTVVVTGAMQIAPSSPGLRAFRTRCSARRGAPRAFARVRSCWPRPGLLDGRRATTHWFHARDLQRTLSANARG